MSYVTLYFNYGHVPIDPKVGYNFDVDEDVTEAENETAVCLNCETQFNLNTELWTESEDQTVIAWVDMDDD
jgi:hypothetical protein